jgi:hypothetical protein
VWCGEAFHRLGVQDIKVLILLGALFLTRVAPVSQQDFGVTEFILSGSAPYSPSRILLLLFELTTNPLNK